ncbi:TonB-dependent receptor [Novosphingobium olei]|uniref:TonB-dependent receptor n=1 Tax=Novosphingobium olei TaxID=2728851 RepID=UPI00308780F4|nr:TonB-dependent receptor [Novosphingobium olei]
MKTLHACALAASAIAISAATPVAAQAQSAEDNGGVAEIVVTAQKKAENLQKVPIAVTALTGDALQAAQVRSVSDLTNSLPNVQINSFSNSPDSAVFTIRGVGVNDADPYVGTTVSVVVDGVVVGVNTAALLSLFDIERVEVLRGPQGTLFGANTTGGVINVVTKQPTGKTGGEAQVVYGNYNQIEADAALNFPITDSLAGKVSVMHNSNDGFFRNTADNRRIGRRDVTQLRGYLKYSAGAYDGTLIGEYVKSRNGSQTGVVIAGPGELFYTPGQTTDPFSFKRGLSSDQPDYNNRDTYALTFTQNVDSAIGKITSITAWRKYDSDLYSDDDGTTRVLLETRRQTHHEQFSQELRDLLQIGDATQLIFGGYYFQQKYFLNQGGKLDGFLPGLSQPQTQDQHNWSISGFAQLYQNLTPELRLQAGIRYSHEKTRAVSTTANGINPSGVATYDDPIIPATFIRAAGSKSWNNTGWKIGLDYQADRNVLLYGYYARGFKSGGFTGRIAIAEDIGPFNPEKLDTYEVGIKSDLLDHHLRLNLAAFYNKYRDMQVVQNITYPSGANSASIANAGRAETKGFELELTAAPARGLTLTGSLAYLDAKYKKYDTKVLGAGGALVAVSYAGNRLMNAPEWSASAGVNYATQLGNGTFNANAQYSYTSSKYTGYTNLPTDLIAPVNLVNASLSWGPVDAGWKIGAYARNLFNEKYFNQKLTLAGIGTLASLGTPREYGATFNYSF